jgi:SpoIVB peptidase S55
VRGLLGRICAVAGTATATALIWSGIALADPPLPCATVMPKADVTAGMTGTGWTVAHGSVPETFDVEVLGVAPNLISPGHDVIIAKVTGPLIDAAGGGIWAGMSGSPVYVGGDLIGAVALSFSQGPSEIAGLTPAEDMLTVGGYPAAARVPARVQLSRAMRARISRSTGSPLASVGATLVRLKLPVSVSGLGLGRFEKVDRLLARRHVAAVTYPGSSASIGASSVGVDSLVPGGNFSAALSYGDLTLAAIGTTTYVCDGTALAFGHPFLQTGRSALGAGDADALAVVTDPTLSPFKLANAGPPVGRLDQDRVAAIRAVDDTVDTIPAHTSLTNLDTSFSRDGQTDVVVKSEFPTLSTMHLLANLDTVFDELDAGSSALDWTVTGEREDGTPWQLERANMYISDLDISGDSVFDFLGDLETLSFNPFEKVTFTGVDVTGTIEDTVKSYKLTALLVCRHGICVDTDTTFARRGQTIRVKAVLTPSDGSAVKKVPFTFTVPRRARAGGLIEIGPARTPRFCFAPQRCRNAIASFDRLLRFLRKQASNNTLRGTFRSGSLGLVRAKDDELLDRVVFGRKSVSVFYPGRCCPPEPAIVDEEPFPPEF